MTGYGNQRAASSEQLRAFSARFEASRDDLGRSIFDARIVLKSGLGVVSDQSRVMVSQVTGDTGEVVVFKTRALDIRLYCLDFTAAFQTFTWVAEQFLRIEGNSAGLGHYVCEIHPA